MVAVGRPSSSFGQRPVQEARSTEQTKWKWKVSVTACGSAVSRNDWLMEVLLSLDKTADVVSLEGVLLYAVYLRRRDMVNGPGGLLEVSTEYAA